MKRLFLIGILLCSVSCGGSSESLVPDANITEAGNPPIGAPKKPRLIKGSVALSKTGTCPISGALSVDTAGLNKEAVLDDQCSFSIELASNKVWFLKFKIGDSIAAQLNFLNGTITRPVYFLSDSPGTVDFGKITITGNKASAQNEVTWQNDTDDDGMNDFQDPDDDNDGILDGAESDCDLDGVVDDYEPEGEECGF